MGIAGKWVLSILILLVTCIISLALAFINEPYFNLVNSFFHTEGAITRALVFSSLFIIIGFVVVVWKPHYYGFQLGDSLKHWLSVLITVLAICTFTAVALLLTPRTPYSGASWFVEMVIVPISEETIWRGVIFSVLITLLSRLHNERTGLTLAVIYSSLAFGLAHSGNMLVLPLQFVLMQGAFASITGLAAGYLRGKTRSIYPALLLHAAYNMVAILF
jgi:membrane protease YdiL (CAAX protease family)